MNKPATYNHDAITETTVVIKDAAENNAHDPELTSPSKYPGWFQRLDNGFNELKEKLRVTSAFR